MDLANDRRPLHLLVSGPTLSSQRIGQLTLQPHSDHKKMTEGGDGMTIHLTPGTLGIGWCGDLTRHEDFLALLEGLPFDSGVEYGGGLHRRAIGHG
jgi:hypothetical protein